MSRIWRARISEPAWRAPLNLSSRSSLENDAVEHYRLQLCRRVHEVRPSSSSSSSASASSSSSSSSSSSAPSPPPSSPAHHPLALLLLSLSPVIFPLTSLFLFPSSSRASCLPVLGGQLCVFCLLAMPPPSFPPRAAREVPRSGCETGGWQNVRAARVRRQRHS